MPALENPRYEKMAQGLASFQPAIQAYEKAGFSSHRGNAHRLARKPFIRARVHELVSQAAELTDITPERVLIEIDRVGRANIVDYIEPETDVDGKPSGKYRLKDLSALPRALTAAIASIEYDSDGHPKLKLHDRNQANFTLLKYLGGIPEDDRPNVTNNILNFLSVEDQQVVVNALKSLPSGKGSPDQGDGAQYLEGVSQA